MLSPIWIDHIDLIGWHIGRNVAELEHHPV